MGGASNPSPIPRLLVLPGAVFLVTILSAYLIVERIRPSVWQGAAIGAATLVILLAASALVLRRARRPLARMAEDLQLQRAQYDRQTAALCESESRYRKIFDTMTEGLLLLDQDGLVVASNPRLTETHGWPAQQIAGRPVTHLLRAQDVELAQALRTPPADRPTAYSGYTRDREGRERATEIIAARLLYQGRPHALVLLRDLSARGEPRSRVSPPQGSASPRQPADDLAHDLNNTLMPILGYSEMLLANPDLSEESRADLLAIRRAAERARSLARRLLADRDHRAAAGRDPEPAPPRDGPGGKKADRGHAGEA